MSKYLIQGGNPLSGTVKVSGAKNAALPILAATLLTNGASVIHNVPNLIDVVTIIRVLRALGVRAEYQEGNTVRVWVNGGIRHVAPYELVTKMRASFFVAGPILARTGLAKIPLPGGCAIGLRPVDIHMKGFAALGAKTEMEHGFVILKADQLRGTSIYLDFPSVGATENILMAAVLAEGTTLIENAAREPEVTDLANFLNQAGAKIAGIGTDILTIQGVALLKGIEYSIIPDRVETGTFMAAGALTHGDIKITGVVPPHLEGVKSKLEEMGTTIQCDADTMTVRGNGRFQATHIKTLPFPGFPTDLQAPFTTLLATAKGTSIISETVFENRFTYAAELNRMGANIQVEDRNAVITGVDQLSGAPIRVTDLRAGAALILAGLMAQGETLVEDTDRHLERGYEHLTEKFSQLGARIHKC